MCKGKCFNFSLCHQVQYSNSNRVGMVKYTGFYVVTQIKFNQHGNYSKALYKIHAIRCT